MSERETIMDLIRNEYDPAPSHYRMGDNWDDGAGRIADAILADKILLLRKHADEIEILKEALTKLTNEVSGWLSEDDAGLREVMSNTNVAVMRNRLEIARTALAALPPAECGGGKSNPVTQAERDIINAAIIPPAPEADAWDRKRSKDGGGK